MQELRDSHVIGLAEELGAGDAVGVEELRYGGIEVVRQVNAVRLMVGRENLIEELCDGDVVGFEEFGRGGAEELADGAVIVEELGNRYIIFREELCHGHVVLLQEVRHHVVEEFSYCGVVSLPGEELSDCDVVLQELGDGRIKIGGHGAAQELCDGDVIGAT
jgi:hypothetical protein